MKKKNKTPLIGQLFQKVAPKIGATVVIEPKWKIVGQITYKNGKKRYFRGSSLDLNSLGASEIARDKDYANFFMKTMGYPIVPGGKTFYSSQWAKAIAETGRDIHAGYKHAVKLGFPVIVKPNGGSQGSGVALVKNKREFYRAMREIFKHDRIAIVQKPVKGKDYRIVVLDNRVISAYERIPLNIIGDGSHTIRQLLHKKQREFTASGRDTKVEPNDPRIANKLKRQKMNMNSVPGKGERIHLLDNANLSTGGDSIDVTSTMHPDFKLIAIKLTKDMGLRLCGVDLMIADDITKKPGEYWVLEINSAPGLDHYAKSGRAQEKIVGKLYLEVLKSMGE
ncbi:MAG: cyanophycin synthetase [Candidatus Staskawiczbacteria bacterium]